MWSRMTQLAAVCCPQRGEATEGWSGQRHEAGVQRRARAVGVVHTAELPRLDARRIQGHLDALPRRLQHHSQGPMAGGRVGAAHQERGASRGVPGTHVWHWLQLVAAGTTVRAGRLAAREDRTCEAGQSPLLEARMAPL